MILNIHHKNLVMICQNSYEYVDSFKKFFDEILLDRCGIFSSLKDECISEKDYSHAINVWNTFKKNTTGHYHGLYLKRDVLLLGYIFEKFIEFLEYDILVNILAAMD